MTDLQRRCEEHGAVLILDEVMTSRLAPGGAQELFDLQPGMSTYGKYLAGGMTFGAFGGRADIMAHFDTANGGPLTQAGTFNNNIVSMSAAVHTLRNELEPARLNDVNQRGERLRRDLEAALDATPFWITGAGSMMCIHGPSSDHMELLFHSLLADGFYMARRGFIALSMEVSDAECQSFVAATSTHATALT